MVLLFTRRFAGVFRRVLVRDLRRLARAVRDGRRLIDLADGATALRTTELDAASAPGSASGGAAPADGAEAEAGAWDSGSAVFPSILIQERSLRVRFRISVALNTVW